MSGLYRSSKACIVVLLVTLAQPIGKRRTTRLVLPLVSQKFNSVLDFTTQYGRVGAIPRLLKQSPIAVSERSVSLRAR